ncbi:MAG: YraN family protein [Prevotella sp.]|uniref:YraN family protein n=1 Tax=Prevotella sp. TaxID=59823 RepID=UPI002A308619|nr:YraN family protein [Prevotella sp.]MDD7318179.1 YraN family protein [Prevotellaceae bacterium]MDY4020932.1 YraN family protein [Prevotella sp.]
MAEHNELGKWGEEIAVRYLQERGYIIIERDWKSRKKDIDIVAIENGVYVFIEVKTRRNKLFGEPTNAVNHYKMQNLKLSISNYIMAHSLNNEIRFDIITVVGKIGEVPEIEHLKDVSLM